MSFIQFPDPTPLFPVLPPLAWSLHKKPILSSSVITAASGRETQLARAVYPRWAFVLTYGGNSWLREQTQNITPDPDLLGFTEFEQISGLFIKCLGSYGEFFYNDPDDNSRLNQFVAVGDGTTVVFPLYYTWGSGPFTPAFYAPVTGINTIDAVYINGSLQNPTSYSISANRQYLVFNSPPTPRLTITASFHFYFRSRFLDDQMLYTQWAKNLWENKEVRFESVKP